LTPGEKRTASGFLVFFADESHVHVCAGEPTGAESWHRLDGKSKDLPWKATLAPRM
jgi:hypothetical protein